MGQEYPRDRGVSLVHLIKDVMVLTCLMTEEVGLDAPGCSQDVPSVVTVFPFVVNIYLGGNVFEALRVPQ